MVSAPASMTFKQASDEALCDHPLPWGRSKECWRKSRGALIYAGQLADIQRILGADLPVTRINQEMRFRHGRSGLYIGSFVTAHAGVISALSGRVGSRALGTDPGTDQARLFFR